MDFFARSEDSVVQDFVSKLAIKALDVSVLPRFPRLNECAFREVQGSEFRAIVADDSRWFSVNQIQPKEMVFHAVGRKAGSRLKKQTLPGVAVKNSKDSNLTTVFKSFMNKVHTPFLVSSGQLGLLLFDDFHPAFGFAPESESFLLPNPVNCLKIYTGKKRRNTPKAVTRILL